MKKTFLLFTLCATLNSASLQASSAEDLGQQLIQATKSGELEKVRQLIAQGANVNATDEYGITPLYCAANNGNIEIIKFLLATPGIFVNTTNNHHDTPLHLAAHLGRTEIVGLFLAHAKK